MTLKNEFDLASYFERIGYSGPAEPDLQTLTALHLAHVDAIPFECIDTLLGRPVLLDLPALQTKLVGNKRGGYCYETNAVFMAALEAIGFKVTGLGARVRWMSKPGSPLGPRIHSLLKVDLPEGVNSYLADVGFGACLLDQPLRFETGTEQVTPMGTFRIAEEDGLFVVRAKQPSGFRDLYAFDLTPQIHSDYELGSFYAANHPDLPFCKALLMERLVAPCRYKLFNTRFLTEGRDGEVLTEKQIDSAEEFETILHEVFRVIPPLPTVELFARISQ